jgi:predicted RNA binding protein YcfA (HicA-like mRNA interferase family)
LRLRLGRLKPEPFPEVKRRLEAAGFVETSQKGSHVKFVRRLGDVVDTAIVPRKSEVPVGTLRSILSQAHIDLEEWETLG